MPGGAVQRKRRRKRRVKLHVSSRITVRVSAKTSLKLRWPVTEPRHGEKREGEFTEPQIDIRLQSETRPAPLGFGFPLLWPPLTVGVLCSAGDIWVF